MLKKMKSPLKKIQWGFSFGDALKSINHFFNVTKKSIDLFLKYIH
jgi:hypothetical protein